MNGTGRIQERTILACLRPGKYLSVFRAIRRMRGFGSPKVFTSLEIAVSQAARKLNMDPVELRLKNLALPYDKDPLTGDSLYNGHARDCLINGRGLFRWDERKRDIPSKNTERYAYGLGVATAMHGNGVAPFAPDITVASIQLNEDGSILLRTGVADHGAGTYTLMKMIAAEILDMTDLIDAGVDE